MVQLGGEQSLFSCSNTNTKEKQQIQDVKRPRDEPESNLQTTKHLLDKLIVDNLSQFCWSGGILADSVVSVRHGLGHGGLQDVQAGGVILKQSLNPPFIGFFSLSSSMLANPEMKV